MVSDTLQVDARWSRSKHPLAQWRRKHGLSQAQVAQAVRRFDVTPDQTTISKIERGRLPEAKLLYALSRLTGIPPKAFMRDNMFAMHRVGDHL